MEPVPKLLVISTSLPGTRHGGGVIQDAILACYPRGRYVCVSLRAPTGVTRPEQYLPSLNGVPCLAVPVVPEPHWRGARFYLPLVRTLGFFLGSPWRVRQVEDFGTRHRVELIWAEFQGESLLLAARVAARLKVPLVGTIWDDPEGWLADGRYDFLSRRFLQLRFREALQAARKVSTVSEAMQAEYRRLYGLESVILRYGHDPGEPPGVPPDRNPEAIVVGFCGNIYGEDAWRGFLTACARLNAEGRLPPVKIQVFGNEGFPYPYPGVEVTCQGWLPIREMLRGLAATDFCYLPYWFTPKKRRHAELSFPTKLTTYLAAGRPVLYHGPAYAWAAQVMRDWRLGPSVHSLCPDDICRIIKGLVDKESLRELFSQAAREAFAKEFNARVMQANFVRLIGGSLPLDSIGEFESDQIVCPSSNV
jgi:glycosyltransferase involved in cell wall biosynthesis